MLAREYATSERLERRRQNVTGWLRGKEAWDEALTAIAEARPHRVLDAGCGDGLFTRVIAAPVVIGVDNALAMVERRPRARPRCARGEHRAAPVR
jgi:SAM-dependent methyltransferase